MAALLYAGVVIGAPLAACTIDVAVIGGMG